MNIFTRSGRWMRSKWGEVMGRGSSAWLVRDVLRQVPENFDLNAAASLPAVGDAVRYLSTRIATLPMSVYDVASDGTETLVAPTDPEAHLLTRRWSAFTGRIEGMTHFLRSVLLHGYGGVSVVKSAAGRPESLVNIDPTALSRELTVDGERVYRFDGHGGSHVIPRDELVFLPFSPPLDGITDKSPLAEHWPSIRAALAATIFSASYFSKGAQPTTFFPQKISGPSDAKALLKDLETLWKIEDRMRAENRRSTIIPGGYDKPVVAGGNARDADLSEQRRYGVEETARIYDLPPIFLGDLSRSTYSNYQSARNVVGETIDLWCRRIEEEANNVIWPAGTRVLRIDTSLVVREPFGDRMRAYDVGVRAGVMSQNQCREMEGWEPSEDEGADSLIRSDVGLRLLEGDTEALP